MIRLVGLDIDGVLTDGRLTFDASGRETKSLDYRDIDAIFSLKRQGYTVAFLTAEDTEMAEFFGRRFELEHAYTGVKDKCKRLKQLANDLGISAAEVCFVGDSARDVEAIAFAGLGACPANASVDAKSVADLQLSRCGGAGAVAELAAELSRRNASEGNEDTITPGVSGDREGRESCLSTCFAEHARVVQAMQVDTEFQNRIASVSSLVGQVLKAGGKIILCGNGGSAADSQHIAAEFVGKFKALRRPLPAIALTVNSSALTAIGNDFSFDQVFSRQLEAFAQPGDLLWGISTSGESRNVLAAIDAAKARGLSTLLMTGASVRSQDLRNCDNIIAVPSSNTPRIQEMHILIAHVICEDAERLFI